MRTLVVGTGRCGSLWLAIQLALCARGKTTVAHETHGYTSRLHLQPIWSPDEDHCEVSQYLTESAPRLLDAGVVERAAFIVREPREVFLSFASRLGDSRLRWEYRCEGIYLAMDELYRRGCEPIWFDLMVSNPDYLSGVARNLGMELILPKIIFGPINQTEGGKATEIPGDWMGLYQVARNYYDKWR